jgi:hypothetical protein
MPGARMCFVIGPFSEPATQVRKWSDFLFQGIIEPVARSEGLSSHRTLDLPQPGRITERVMRELHEADLVIADLTQASPNAFYELGVRHATGKPVVHVAQIGTTLPFDIHDYECVMVEADYGERAGRYLIGDDKKKRAQEALRAHIKRAQERSSSIKARYTTHVFSWWTRYSRTIATDWLAAQPQWIQDSVRKYEQAEDQVFTEPVKLALAEYLQLKSAANQRYEGTTFIVLSNQASRVIEVGGAVYSFPGSPPVYIPIGGYESEHRTWEITFDQPSRRVRVGLLDEVLPAYNYTVSFKRDGDGLVGDIEHPFSGTLIGHATMTPKYGTRLDGSPT